MACSSGSLPGLLVDLNQYVLFPIPAVVAAQWFLGGLIEFSLYGIIASRLYPPLQSGAPVREAGKNMRNKE